MPRKNVVKNNSASTSSLRRSQRIAYRIKSMVKEQSLTTSSKEKLSSTKKRGKPSSIKKSVAKSQLASSKAQSISTNEKRKPSYGRKSGEKRQHASSNEGQSTSTGESTAKRRRIMKTDEINENASPPPRMEEIDESASETDIDEISERASQMEINEQSSNLGKQGQDFSIYIKAILEELSPDLTISEEALSDLSLGLNIVFERLTKIAAAFKIGKSDGPLTDKDIETAVVHGVNGDLAKYCIAEGRRAVKKWNKEK